MYSQTTYHTTIYFIPFCVLNNTGIYWNIPVFKPWWTLDQILRLSAGSQPSIPCQGSCMMTGQPGFACCSCLGLQQLGTKLPKGGRGDHPCPVNIYPKMAPWQSLSKSFDCLQCLELPISFLLSVNNLSQSGINTFTGKQPLEAFVQALLCIVFI